MSDLDIQRREQETGSHQPPSHTPSDGVALVVQTPQTLETSRPAVQPTPPLTTPATPRLQRQAVQPVLAALGVRQGAEQAMQAERAALQRQVDALGPEHTETDPTPPGLPSYYTTPPQERRGQSPSFSDVAGLYGHEIGRVMQTDNGRGVLSAPLTTLQRTAVGQFGLAYRGSDLPVVQRAQALGESLASLQRLPFGTQVNAALLGSAGNLPKSDLPLIQRALHEANAALVEQDQRQTLQRQLAEQDGPFAQAQVMQRIRERQGAGDPLPESVQRHLETGLNADLSGVRIHTDPEADGLAKGVQATAFTSGRDIYFRSGQFQPNTRSGLALLGHEVTHTVQQATGRVGAGIDPDAGLEQQAQQMGERLSAGAAPEAPVQRSSAWPGQTFSLQRQAAPTASETPTIQRKPVPRDSALFRELAGETVRQFSDAVDRGDMPLAEQRFQQLSPAAQQWHLQNATSSEFFKPAFAAKLQAFLKHHAAQTGQTSAPLTTQADSLTPPTPGVNAQGFIEYQDEGANIRSGPAELPGSRTLTPQPLPNATRVFVSGHHPQKPEWLYVTAQLSGGLVRGYVQNFRVNIQLPEPTATLHEIKQGDQLRPLSGNIYHQNVQPGRDLRFYEEAVLYVNQQAGRNGVSRGGDGSVHLMAGKRIWLVSPAFANSLQGKIPSGSITGGAVAEVNAGIEKAKEVGQHLQDVLASITQSPQHFGAVAAEYRDAIYEHRAQIIGVMAAFAAGEMASALLASTPTGVGQLAAAAIQLGLAAWGAYGAAEAASAAIPHAQAWITTAWKANGDAKLIAQASESFVKMAVQIALAALALLGGRTNLGRGLKLAEGVKITPPSFQMMQTVGGPSVAVPVFHPGSIEAVGSASLGRPNLMTGTGTAGGQAKLSPEEAAAKTQRLQALAKKIRGLGPDVLRKMEELGGHTILKHVGRTRQWLIQRANREDVPAATSFTNQSTGTKAVLENVRNNADAIAEYLEGVNKGTRPKAFTFTHDFDIGYGVKAGRKNVVDNLRTSEVIIKFDESSPYGFIILTATAKMR